MKMKKSQITIFLIIIFFLFILGFFLFNYDFKIGFIGYKDKFDKDSINLNKLFYNCINDIVYSFINEYGLCGVENDIKNEIQLKLYQCLDLDKYKDQGYEVDAKKLADEIIVNINTDNIVVYLIYPVELKKDELRYFFYSSEFKLPRKVFLKPNLNFENKLKNDFFLVSSDKNVELYIPKNTNILGLDNNKEISIYMKELCPLNPSIVNKVKYVIEPNLNFEPDAFITIRYKDLFTKNLKEDKLKVSYLNDNFWDEIKSNSYPENDQIKAQINHLSEWAGSCEGTNKLGINLMFNDIALEDSTFSNFIINRDLNCAFNFSGPCGYAKIMVYLKPDIENSVLIYDKIIKQIYYKNLIPVLVINEQKTESFWSHPGVCTSEILDCKYGENEDGSAKPAYDYTSSVSLIKEFLDTIHKEIPEWPLYVQLWDEPNLAYRWNDISLTDYQIKTYVDYYYTLAKEIKQLPHSKSIYLMPAALAPTNGMKKCELTPEFAKKYDDKALNDPIEKTIVGDSALLIGDCKKLGYMPDYNLNGQNYCNPSLPEIIDTNDCNEIEVKENPVDPRDNNDIDEEKTEQEKEECCNNQKEYISKIKNLRSYYNEKMSKIFNNELYDDPKVECTIENVKLANQINQRIKDTIVDYCWEKITEVNTNDYLEKIYSSSDKICPYMDIYSDHSYIEDFDLSFPGGDNPFGMLSYKDRFNFVLNNCNNYMNLNCVPESTEDRDSDGIIDLKDNCPDISNPDQEDIDLDGKGDFCDDSDNDEVTDNSDKCPFDFERIFEEDSDSDGIADVCDNCPNLANRYQTDLDLDDIGDDCDDNNDNDGIPEIGFDIYCSHSVDNCKDNCRYIPNGPKLGVCLNNKENTCTSDSDCSGSSCQKSQEDKDYDGIGDVCDNCPNIANSDQKDWNKDGIGDKCQDSDKDGFNDDVDFCPLIETEENTEEACNAKKLCVGKIMISEFAWAIHPRIYPQIIDNSLNPNNKKFEVDDYKEKILETYKKVEDDEIVLAFIPFNIGENESIIKENLRNYSFTKEFCENNCIGKDIFNLLAQNENPITDCSLESKPIVEGECNIHKYTLQNLREDVGKDNIVYKCYKCDNNNFLSPLPVPEKSFNVNGINYLYYGITDCFEKEVALPEYCPDSDGTVREGYLCDEVELDGTKYYAIIRCEPSITSNNALLHLCGTIEECNNDKSNCCEVGGTYGRTTISCKKIN